MDSFNGKLLNNENCSFSHILMIPTSVQNRFLRREPQTGRILFVRSKNLKEDSLDE
jgi:hypothetical protein